MNLTYDIGFIYNPDLKVEKTFDYRDKIFSNQLIIGEVPWGNIEAGINGVKSVFMPVGAFIVETDFAVRIVYQTFTNQIVTKNVSGGINLLGNYEDTENLIRKIISITSIDDVDTSVNAKTIKVSQAETQGIKSPILFSGGFLVDNSYSNPFCLTIQYGIYNTQYDISKYSIVMSGLASFSSGNYLDNFFNYSSIDPSLQFEQKDQMYYHSINNLSLNRFLFGLFVDTDESTDPIESFDFRLKVTQGGR